MGLMDTLKGLIKGKGEKIDGAIDKVGDVVDDKTGGKYTDKIESAQEKAKDVVDKIEGDEPK